NEQQTISIRAHYCRESLRFYLRLLHSKQIIQINSEYPRYKPNNIKPPLHYEHRQKNNGWPNQEGKVMLDSKLTYNKKLRQWTFIWVYGKEVCKNQADYIHVAAIDPEVCTFLTWYSPTIGHGNFGDNDINRIFRLGLVVDDLISRTSKALAKKRNSMKRAQARLRNRIQNLIDEVHKKAALWLTRTFDVIVLPIFDSTRMSRRQKRKINSKTVRKMMSWAHARFKKQLISKMEEFGKI
ncbi:2648_t:CDS:1, partial [Cetraspora pellucida]